ncbi:VOC family protein [Nonomuraea roseoviolacea subsp. roseoviolacea]|uniref:Catechol 2,3-dioxygenase-like lactoylglutathione lyase family enzyme n=1 Tax=Nonomuraea roseoviolacea subsp. carminata TaxID=160689 RepID=A0ABT1K2X9_9ACTN|nr:VOC family protein [Nonomuraea roseoviolacea]MCP2347962.1 catechol 2,3-dioxygenase-like lactoylglutathione lyase family enzyme [Nonomuraea roseoviolacea subsp. carminata]
MIEIHAVTIDAADPYELGSWWSNVTGLPLHEENVPGDDEVMLRTKQDPFLLFIRVPEGKTVKNRVHLDVNGTEGRTRDEEVERLLGLGATVFEDHRKADGTGWVTMRDPEGNEFCVCRSQAEKDGLLG